MSPRTSTDRHAVVAVAMIAMMVVINLIIVGMVVGQARDHDGLP